MEARREPSSRSLDAKSRSCWSSSPRWVRELIFTTAGTDLHDVQLSIHLFPLRFRLQENENSYRRRCERGWDIHSHRMAFSLIFVDLSVWVILGTAIAAGYFSPTLFYRPSGGVCAPIFHVHQMAQQVANVVVLFSGKISKCRKKSLKKTNIVLSAVISKLVISLARFVAVHLFSKRNSIEPEDAIWFGFVSGIFCLTGFTCCLSCIESLTFAGSRLSSWLHLFHLSVYILTLVFSTLLVSIGQFVGFAVFLCSVLTAIVLTIGGLAWQWTRELQLRIWFFRARLARLRNVPNRISSKTVAGVREKTSHHDDLVDRISEKVVELSNDDPASEALRSLRDMITEAIQVSPVLDQGPTIRRDHRLDVFGSESSQFDNRESRVRFCREVYLDDLDFGVGTVPGDRSSVGGLSRGVVKRIGVDSSLDILSFSDLCRDPLVDVGFVLLVRSMTTCVLADVPRTAIFELLRKLENAYQDVPFHSSMHAATVTHFMACVFRFLGLADSGEMSPIEETASLVAALGHDVGHCARNNGYYVSSSDKLAILYNDMSVLEHYHAAILFSFLRLPKCNIFSPLPRCEFRAVRSLIIELILATDLGTHVKSCHSYRQRCQSENFDTHVNLQDRVCIYSMVLKLADVNFCCLPWNPHCMWSLRLAEEMYSQTDVEVKLGCPPSSVYRRDKHFLNFPLLQTDFCKFVVLPMAEALERIDDTRQIRHHVTDQIVRNLVTWEEAIARNQFELKSIEPTAKMRIAKGRTPWLLLQEIMSR